MKKIILGSASPRRYELLKNAGIDFEVLVSDCEEIIDKTLDFPDMVKSLALQKNRAVKKDDRAARGAVIITADTMVLCGGKIMGKPKNDEEANEMLSRLSGRTHYVLTGYCISQKGEEKERTGVCKSAVHFRELSDEEIKNYIKTGECRDKAGAYGIQLRGSMFVEKIEGDYFNIVGLPVCEICKILKEDFNVSLL